MCNMYIIMHFLDVAGSVSSEEGDSVQFSSRYGVRTFYMGHLFVSSI